MSLTIINAVSDSATRVQVERCFMAAEAEAEKLKTSPRYPVPLYQCLNLLRWVATQGKDIRSRGATLHKRKSAIVAALDFKNPPALHVPSGDNSKVYHSGEHIPMKVSEELTTEFLDYSEELERVRQAEILFRQYVVSFDRIRERVVCSAVPLNSEAADILSVLRVSIPSTEWDGRKVNEHHHDKIHSRLIRFLALPSAEKQTSIVPLFGLSSDKRNRMKKGKTGRVSLKRGEEIIRKLPTQHFTSIPATPTKGGRIARLRGTGTQWGNFVRWYCETVKRTGDNDLDKQQAFALRSFLFGEHSGENPESWDSVTCPDVFEFLETYPRPAFATQDRDNAFLNKLTALNKLASAAFATTNGIDRAIRVSRPFFPVNPDYTRTTPEFGTPLAVTLKREDFGTAWPFQEESLSVPVVACQNLVISGTKSVIVRLSSGEEVRRTVSTADRWVCQTEFGLQRTGYRELDNVLKGVYTFHSDNRPVWNERRETVSSVDGRTLEFDVIGSLSTELASVVVAHLSQRCQDRAKQAASLLQDEKRCRKEKADKLRLLRSLDSVTIEDSLKSGNCQAGTEQFVRNVLQLPSGVSSVDGRTLAKLWRVANYVDHYLFFRCIEQAAKRQKQEQGNAA